MAMDQAVADWLGSLSRPDLEPGTALERGWELLRAEPMMPRVVNADCHCRLAALAHMAGDPARCAAHAAHAVDLAMDLSTEGQLHVLARAVPMLEASLELLPDVSPALGSTARRGSDALARAMEESVATADAGLTRLATLTALAEILSGVEGDTTAARRRIGDEAARLVLEFEAAGEMTLGARARRLAD